MSEERPKIALWFRYGPAEHSELFHAIPDIVERLAQHAEVHYFGLKSKTAIPELIQKHAIIHHLPFTVDRTRNSDKIIKTLLWILCLPWVGSRCKLLRIDAVYIDETVPMTAWIARTFYGENIAFSAVDFFPEIYFGKTPILKPLVALFRKLEYSAWRKLPVLFTRAKATQKHLGSMGFDTSRMHPVYDPCDFSVYHPMDRAAAKATLGFKADDIVLVHHGVLHPNKGNDWIIENIAALSPHHPHLKYLLIGDGPEMDRLKALVRERNLETTVIFTGWLPKLEQVNEALNAGDIGLVMRVGMPEDDFHMTGALIHSMACALPVLTARLAGVCEVIQEDDAGLIFDPTRPRRLSTSVS